MAVVITIAQQKGGTGKTTLAANIAAAFAPSRRVALLDIDPQKSSAAGTACASLAMNRAAALAFSDISGWRLAGELDGFGRDHDVVLIDSPPQLDTDARVAVRAADIVLVPIQPRLPDIWAAEGTLALAAKSGAARIWCQSCPADLPPARNHRSRPGRCAACPCCTRLLAIAPASRMPSPPALALPGCATLDRRRGIARLAGPNCRS